MANRSYQYETSPRKYEPEYDEKPRRKRTKKAQKKKKVSNNSIQEKKRQRREKIKYRTLFVLNLLMFFTILFAIMCRNALINQSFSEIQRLQTQISDIQKENDQLEISIQNSLNLSSIEQTAKDMLGMQKLTNKQTLYLTLPKKDYVEPSTEEIILEENSGIIQTIIDFLKNIF